MVEGDTLMIVTCQHCKEEVDVSMYFYNHMITKEQFLPTDAVEYKAFVIGKAICPFCGAEINKKFSSIISRKDIIRLAIGKEINK